MVGELTQSNKEPPHQSSSYRCTPEREDVAQEAELHFAAAVEVGFEV